MPCGVTCPATGAASVALAPIVHGLQFACVTGNVHKLPFEVFENVNEPLKAESDEPAIVPLVPPAIDIPYAVIVATLLETEMLITGTGAPGTNVVVAGPAVGIATPCWARKSLTPPLHVIVFDPLVMAQVIVGGVLLTLLYPPKRARSNHGFGPLVWKSASTFCCAVNVF